ncbi:hypothetical protein SLEP1_g37736 [Rubroshorea leprosula]|uniref:PGG domain-containing protein n=1 Tax=Rubroshorea leprosula TaxID=152421 RepID=A0AAV5KVN4_9ROSI|nr:hypothetical protein SLEP1_g37736 [Rubroshorea leprosula]
MQVGSNSSTTAIVPFLLKEDNYEDWSIYVENYLLAQDLLGIVESEDSCSEDVGYWRKKKAAALHAIHITSSPEIFAQIKKISSAKDAWNKLAKMHQEWKSKAKTLRILKAVDEMTENPHYVELKKSICKGDWDGVKQFFVFHKYPLNTIIVSSDYCFTALQFAIDAGRDKIAEELLKMISERDLEIIKTNSASGGHTCLSSVAFTGRTHVARCIVQKNRNLLIIESDKGFIPVTGACSVGQKEMTYYLYSETPAEVLAPQNGNHGFRLIRSAIANKMLDICYDLLGRFPSLAVATDKEMQGVSPILALSRQPSAFPSGCRLQLWKKRIYHGLKVKLPTTSSGEVRIPVPQDQYLNKKNVRIQVFDRLGGLSLTLLNFFGIKQIYDLKLTHRYALLILHRMCNHVSTLKVQHHFDCGVVDAMFEATKQGIVEFVVELLKVSQPLIYYNRDRRHVFMVAIQYRQENIFNRFYGIHEDWKALLLGQVDNKENNTLHVAGEIAPDFQLARISSPALQMQRELQWFKEVEKIVPEWCKEHKNHNGETPYEVFSKSHKELVKEGGQWMRNTAESFIIVGTLIVTIMFAVAFTVRGGSDQNTGFPIFLLKRSFMIFIISDAISFFAASTSVLMFLGILTSRFAQEDFLVSLPRKLIIGLSTLFISIAAMMISFSAAFLIMLQDRWSAIIPIILMASIPVTLFVWLQFPLLLKIFVSTYTPGIFDKKIKPWL